MVESFGEFEPPGFSDPVCGLDAYFGEKSVFGAPGQHDTETSRDPKLLPEARQLVVFRACGLTGFGVELNAIWVIEADGSRTVCQWSGDQLSDLTYLLKPFWY